jgi:hypothetical protein
MDMNKTLYTARREDVLPAFAKGELKQENVVGIGIGSIWVTILLSNAEKEKYSFAIENITSRQPFSN